MFSGENRVNSRCRKINADKTENEASSSSFHGTKSKASKNDTANTANTNIPIKATAKVTAGVTNAGIPEHTSIPALPINNERPTFCFSQPLDPAAKKFLRGKYIAITAHFPEVAGGGSTDAGVDTMKATNQSFERSWKDF